MNMLQSFALLCCMIQVGSCFFGLPEMEDVFTKIHEPDEFCDEGPPGRYCLADLSGWHDCHVEKGQMVDTINNCPANTRCACFFGPACPGSLTDPCQPYRLPPPFQPKFTLYFNGHGRQCSPMGCKQFYFTGRQIQSLDEKKKREDVYEMYSSTTFIHPGNGSSFAKTDVRWDKEECVTQQIKEFPSTAIPSYFSYNGKVKLGDRLCDQWIWKTGGHNPGQGTSSIAFYMYNQTDVEDQYVPVFYEANSNTGPVGKTSLYLNITIPDFRPGVVDEEQLKLPSFCKS
ncbi:uncharacterized protein [Montipora capricornis]|uniref:uncharacterized protein n=1 Tax=Montipora capricornis TaxID=246305 RepID=UPI0035F1EE91